MTIDHNFVHSERSKKIINLKTEMRGACQDKVPTVLAIQLRKEGSDEGEVITQKRSRRVVRYGGLYFFGETYG
jgi:hypothetical protein